MAQRETIDMLPISEIFSALQGEGPNTGRRTTFVRIAGCNLAVDGHPCLWCDTVYSQKESDGELMSVKDIVERVNSLGNTLVTITGGEPLTQNLRKLTDELMHTDHRISIETNGCMDLDAYVFASYAYDVKLPSSGNWERNKFEFEILNPEPGDFIKVVIGTTEDIDYADKALGCVDLRIPIYVTPVWGVMDMRLLTEWVLTSELNLVLGTQLQKIVYGANVRGV